MQKIIFRICRYCGLEGKNEESLLKNFTKDSGSPGGYQNMCKECARNRTRKYRDKNRKTTLYKNRRRISNIKQYGITKEEYEKLVLDQKNMCAICLTDFAKQKRNPYIDHDHSCCPEQKSCGKCVRGLLCFKCNLWIGSANDDIILLERAIKYLTGENKIGYKH